ncbi:hypothetical protein ACIPUP_05265 [Pectobacterium actinidiae]|uniref:Uncharacterized protein n=1 Tax=Pectobacterium actinidiae TaxID=1507808 RepID=A0ABW8GAL8_9GAMM
MKCDCIKRIGNLMEERLSEGVPSDAEINRGFDTGWENTVFGLSDGKIHVMMKYKLAYRATKKNGEPAKNLTRLEASVKMSFCPFCGQSIDDSSSKDKGGNV